MNPGNCVFSVVLYTVSRKHDCFGLLYLRHSSNNFNNLFVDNKVVLLSISCDYYFSPSHFIFETWYTAWLKTISMVHVFAGSAETLVRRGGITNHRSIAYFPSNVSAKNNYSWLICVEVIVCYIGVVFFLRHSVQMNKWQ